MWDHAAIKKHKLFTTAKLSALGAKGFTRGRVADEKRDDEYARVAEAINRLAEQKGLPVSFPAAGFSIVLVLILNLPCRVWRRYP